MNALIGVRRAYARRASASQQCRDAIIAARDEGHSLRAIADAAGISHVRVLQILRGE